MSLRGFKGNQNMQQFMGQNPLPMRGVERFMQKRGMNFPGMLQGGTFQGGNFQGMNPQAGAGNLANTLNVDVPAKKSGGIKEFIKNKFGH